MLKRILLMLPATALVFFLTLYAGMLTKPEPQVKPVKPVTTIKKAAYTKQVLTNPQSWTMIVVPDAGRQILRIIFRNMNSVRTGFCKIAL